MVALSRVMGFCHTSPISIGLRSGTPCGSGCDMGTLGQRISVNALAIIDPMAQEQGTPQASSVSVLGPRCHCSCPPTKRSLRAPKGQKAIFCRTSPGADLIL